MGVIGVRLILNLLFIIDKFGCLLYLNDMIEVCIIDEFNEWLCDFCDVKGCVCIFVWINWIEEGNFGDIKLVGGGVSEL